MPDLFRELWSKQIPGSLLLTLYGPALLLGLVLCFALSPGRRRAGVMLGLVLFALILLTLQLLLGFPLTQQVAEFNQAVQGNPNMTGPESTFTEPPQMTLKQGWLPFVSLVLLLVAGVVAGLGFRFASPASPSGEEPQPAPVAPEESGQTPDADSAVGTR